MTRQCAQCGIEVPNKKPRASKSTGQRASAPKNRAVLCAVCRAPEIPCSVCGEMYSKTHAHGETCSVTCGHWKAAETRGQKHHVRRYTVTVKRRVVKAVQPEWRGSAIDKVRALRGETV